MKHQIVEKIEKYYSMNCVYAVHFYLLFSFSGLDLFAHFLINIHTSIA